MRVVDLHAHYAMHLLPDAAGDPLSLLTRGAAGDRWRDRANAALVRLASRVANYESTSAGPGVTVPRMLEGGVAVCCSALYSPFDEWDLTKWRRGEPPDATYFPTLQRQMDVVEQSIREQHAAEATVARTLADLEAALDAGRLALVHSVEGGFHVGESAAAIDRNTTTLAERGVATLTVAHLIFRGIATNAAALPFLTDGLYHALFRQPKGTGLTELGDALVRAMVRERITVDITHMSRASLHDTFALLDELDPARGVPVIASHIACRFGRLEYNLDDDTIAQVAERGGALGVIFCDHYVRDGLAQRRTQSFEQTLDVMATHIDRIARVTGSYDHVAIGSDLDGYIKPTVAGLEHMGKMRDLADALTERYGAAVAQQICCDNALRTLRAGWR